MDSDVKQWAAFWKAYGWFETHRKQVTYGAGAAVLIGFIVYFIVWQQAEKQTAANRALSNVLAGQMASTGPVSAEAFLKIATDYPNSRAAARATLLAARSLFNEGKYAEAVAQFQKYGREHPGSPFRGQALLGVAACLEAQGKTNEALTAYKELVERHPNESVIPQAKFALARHYEAQGKPEQAKNLFEDVATGNPYSSIGSEAGIRAEELKIKYPHLVPVMPTFTNAAPLALTNLPPIALTNAAPAVLTNRAPAPLPKK